jgi:hypothetical protein
MSGPYPDPARRFRSVRERPEALRSGSPAMHSLRASRNRCNVAAQPGGYPKAFCFQGVAVAHLA